MPATRKQQAVVVLDSRSTPAPPDVTEAVAQAVRAGFGLAALCLVVALRTSVETRRRLRAGQAR